MSTLKKRTRLAAVAAATIAGSLSFVQPASRPPGIRPVAEMNREQRRAAEREQRRRASSMAKRSAR